MPIRTCEPIFHLLNRHRVGSCRKKRIQRAAPPHGSCNSTRSGVPLVQGNRHFVKIIQARRDLTAGWHIVTYTPLNIGSKAPSLSLSLSIVNVVNVVNVDIRIYT